MIHFFYLRVHLLLGQVTDSSICMMSAQIFLVMALDSEQHSYMQYSHSSWCSTGSFVFFLFMWVMLLLDASNIYCWSCILLVPLGLHAPWLFPNSCIPFVPTYESPRPIGPFGPVALLVLN